MDATLDANLSPTFPACAGVGVGVNPKYDTGIVPILGDLVLGMIGDSTVDQNDTINATSNLFENVGVAVIWNAKLNSRFTMTPALNKGTSGYKFEDLVTNITDIDDLAGLGATDLYLGVGTNDINENAATGVASMVESLDTIIARATITNEMRIIIEEISPREDEDGEAERLAINAIIRERAKTNPMVKSIPVPSDWDATTDVDTVDGVHKSPKGALKYALSAIAAHPEYGAAGNLSPSAVGVAGGEIDGSMAGTGGSVGSVATGDLATGWSALGNGTTNASWVTMSKTAEGYQQIDINIPQGSGSSCGIYIYRATFANSGVRNYTAAIDYSVEITSGDLEEANLEIREEGSGANIYHVAMDESAGDFLPSYGDMVAETPPITTVSGSTAMRTRFMIQGDATAADIVATIIIKAVSVVDVT